MKGKKSQETQSKIYMNPVLNILCVFDAHEYLNDKVCADFGPSSVFRGFSWFLYQKLDHLFLVTKYLTFTCNIYRLLYC